MLVCFCYEISNLRHLPYPHLYNVPIIRPNRTAYRFSPSLPVSRTRGGMWPQGCLWWRPGEAWSTESCYPWSSRNWDDGAFSAQDLLSPPNLSLYPVELKVRYPCLISTLILPTRQWLLHFPPWSNWSSLKPQLPSSSYGVKSTISTNWDISLKHWISLSSHEKSTTTFPH